MKASRGGIHYGGIVLGALVVGRLSGAAALSRPLPGAAGPLVGRLADQWGPRRVVMRCPPRRASGRE